MKTLSTAMFMLSLASVSGAQTSPSVNVTVLPAPPPPASITLTASCADPCTAPASIVLTAVPVNLPAGSGVIFRVGSNVLATLPAAPWSYTWPNVKQGDYSFTASVVLASGGVIPVPPNPDIAWCVPPTSLEEITASIAKTPVGASWAIDCHPEAGHAVIVPCWVTPESEGCQAALGVGQ